MSYTEQPYNNAAACLKLAESTIADLERIKVELVSMRNRYHQMLMQHSRDTHEIHELRSKVRVMERKLNFTPPLSLLSDQAH
jgi:Tfp pilus assembly protein PilO